MVKDATLPIELPAGDQASRRVVVIMGSGRSGTSLCAKIVGKLGVRMEATLHRPNEMNPEGFFEDGVLGDINKRLYDKLVPSIGFGPVSDASNINIGPEMRELREHLKAHAFDGPQMWGFKHPRVSLLLPYYRRAFQAVGIVPRYVMCARDPGAVVQSLQDATGSSRAICENVYFIRNFLALRDSAANCHVIHYEKLLDEPAAQIAKLWNYIREKDDVLSLSEEDCASWVDKKLNRSQLRATPVSNPFAARIGAMLDAMEGTDFDRDAVHQELRDIDAIHSVYQASVEHMSETSKTALEKLEKSNAALTKQVEQSAKEQEKNSKLLADARDKTANYIADLKVVQDKATRQHDTDVASIAEEVAARQIVESQSAKLHAEIEALRLALQAARDEIVQEVKQGQTALKTLAADLSKTVAEKDILVIKLSKVVAEKDKLTSELDAVVADFNHFI